MRRADDQSEFPYDFGPTFVAALVAKGGNSEVDAAFRNPPTLDGQILDPETYVPGAAVPAVTVPPPPGGSSLITPPSGFGELTLVEMLGDEIGFGPAWAAVQGWMQDRYVLYRQNGHVCVDLAVLDDSPTSAASLAQSGQAWAGHLASASVSRSGMTVDFLSCDPGPEWKPPVHVADPYQALAVRSVVTYDLITDGHLDTTTATCAASQVLTSMGAQQLEQSMQSSDPASSEIQALRAATSQAVASCS